MGRRGNAALPEFFPGLFGVLGGGFAHSVFFGGALDFGEHTLGFVGQGFDAVDPFSGVVDPLHAEDDFKSVRQVFLMSCEALFSGAGTARGDARPTWDRVRSSEFGVRAGWWGFPFAFPFPIKRQRR